MKNRLEQINEVMVGVIIGLCIFFIISNFFIPISIQGSSMSPTLYDGSRYILKKNEYHDKNPERGDIVLFKLLGYYDDEYLVKRIIGLEGESVEIRNNNIYINDKLLDEPYLYNPNNGSDMEKITLKEGEYFVMGDNRGNSVDSRDFGPVLKKELIGELILR